MATAADRPADRPFSDRTLKELRSRAADLELRAEVLREQQRHKVATSPSSLALARQLKTVSQRADEYAALVRMAQERGVEQ